MNSCISMGSLWELQSFSSDFVFLGFIFACTLIRTVMTCKGSGKTAPLKGRSSTRHHRLHPSHRKQRSQGSRSSSAYHSTSWAHGLSLNCPSIFCTGGLRFQYQILNVSVIFHPPSTKKTKNPHWQQESKTKTHTCKCVSRTSIQTLYTHNVFDQVMCMSVCIHMFTYWCCIYLQAFVYMNTLIYNISVYWLHNQISSKYIYCRVLSSHVVSIMCYTKE